uniref:RNA exonuclease 4 n=1 Tax=Heliothis virescens TaxID=7102 RepID=A0A2A4IXJ3_HELVI
MSNVFIQKVLYLLLIVIEFVLAIVYSVINSVFLILKLLLHYVFNVNMTESSKKRKRNSNDQPNQTVALRGAIDANWQKFLSSSLIMDKKTEKPAQENNKAQYSGTFRRARKKKAKDHDTVQNDLKTLNLASNGDTLVNKVDLDKNCNSNNVIGAVKNNNNNKNRITKFLAMDCEMVGVGYDGNDHMLARVSIVNKFGDCIYDKFVKAREEVKDYRTDVSGVRKEDLLNGEDFTTVQKEVSELIKGRILVGHSLKNDLSVLFLSHPKRNIRDTSRYKPFRKITKGSTPSLKRLAKEILGIDIQSGEHSSVEDARAAMQLYCSVARQWEPTLADKRGKRKVNPDDD